MNYTKGNNTFNKLFIINYLNSLTMNNDHLLFEMANIQTIFQNRFMH